MSTPRRSRSRGSRLPRSSHAVLFAALGDGRRLALVGQLAEGGSLSIAQLSEGTRVTRQAITKHLRVLEEVGLVSSAKTGRENLYRLSPAPLADARAVLDVISRRWDEALLRLKTMVELPDT